MQDIGELITGRYSVRKYAEKPVEEEKLDKILRVTQHSPTAVNCQCQRVYVLKSQEALEKARSVCSSLFNASLVLAVCYDEERARVSSYNPGTNSGMIDATICADEMMLQAWSLGIGSCWVGAFNTQKLQEALDLPKTVRPVCLLPMGYPAEDSVPLAGWHDATRPLADMVIRL